MAACECKWLEEDQTSFLDSLASTVLEGNMVVVKERTVVGNNLAVDPYSDRLARRRVADKDWVPSRPPAGMGQVLQQPPVDRGPDVLCLSL